MRRTVAGGSFENQGVTKPLTALSLTIFADVVVEVVRVCGFVCGSAV